jgi:hypothetical protein
MAYAILDGSGYMCRGTEVCVDVLVGRLPEYNHLNDMSKRTEKADIREFKSKQRKAERISLGLIVSQTQTPHERDDVKGNIRHTHQPEER